jgi:threonine aldolase
MHIDLRSDTVTKPTPGMREAMYRAEVGDDVYGEDPTVNRLEARAAEMLGTESAVFAASGTQANLMGILAHCGRGDEYIVGQAAHTYRMEGGGAAVLGSVQPQPIQNAADGSLPLAEVEAAVKPEDVHFARTRLLCLENTKDGKALALEYIRGAAELARRHRLGFHLDGARVFNAAAKHQVPVARLTEQFDTVSFCLSKGLGAPVGSLLCGSTELVSSARRWRKVLGGGMRQAGILAAAGLYALDHHVERLSEDHENARVLAAGLSEIPALSVGFPESQTNMVFVSVPPARVEALVAHLRERHVLVRPVATMRLVCHLDISAEAVREVIKAFREFFRDS